MICGSLILNVIRYTQWCHENADFSEHNKLRRCGDAGCYFLPCIVGIANAFELIWSGRMIEAEEPLRIGYVSKVVSHEQLPAATKELCSSLPEPL